MAVASCVVLVAAAGYGKTTALEARAAAVPGTVVVDDLDRLPLDGQVRAAEDLAALPAPTPVVLASARPLAPAVRAALGRPVVVRTAADLALGPDGTARVLRDEHGLDDPQAAEEVHRRTGGWPALVHLEAVGAPCEPWLEDHVLARLDGDALVALSVAALLGIVAPGLLAGLETSGLLPGAAAAGPAVADLGTLGLLRAEPPDAWSPVPAVVPAVLVRAADALGPRAGDDAVLRAAATWAASAGHTVAAVALLRRLGDDDAAARLLAGRGGRVLAAGRAGAVAEHGTALLGAGDDPEVRRRVRLLVADALRMTGDALGALEVLAPLRRSGTAPSAALARRLALVEYMRGDPRAALDAARSVGPPHGDEAADDAVERALLAAGEVVCLHAVGEEGAARDRLAEALRLAEAVDDPAATATAQLAAAIGTTGARREAHLRRAGRAARAAGDAVLQARVLVHETDAALARARYAEAARLAVEAVRLGSGLPPGLAAVAHANACAALRRVGRVEEARYHGERALHVCRVHGVDRLASGLLELGELTASQGRLEHGRLLLEEAVDLAREAGQVHVLVPALCALARLQADARSGQPAAAELLAKEALDRAPGVLLAHALVARGWAALGAGDAAAAGAAADRAVEEARRTHRLPALADALELRAAAARDTDLARSALREARTLWQESGAVPDADRVGVLLGRLPGGTGEERAAARDAAQRLADVGVAVPADDAAGDAAGLVAVRVLGGFEVRASGRPVPLAAWRSRQARVLVKVLVARRGRPVSRGEVCELLWPDDEPQRTAHRLSVLLSTVRGVLDPLRCLPPDHVVRADAAGLALDLRHVRVDAEELLHDAAHAEQVLREGDAARARELLAEVDRRYAGDAFDDEPYEEWAHGLREEVRAAWLRALRRHARLSHEAGDTDDAVRDLVRILSADPYDESAHRGLVRLLVRAGRHGEARRAFDRWCRAMAGLDAPPPDPAVLTAGR